MAKKTTKAPKENVVAKRVVGPAAARLPRKAISIPSKTTDGDIARRAYDLYLARGCAHGHDVDDWLQAERELRDLRNQPAA